MGLFSWLFGGARSQTQVSDLVWLTGRAKLEGIVADLTPSPRDKQFALVVAHFPETLKHVKAAASAAGIDLIILDGAITPEHIAALAAHGPDSVFAVLGKQLRESERLPAPEEQRPALKFVAAERHFLPECDEAIVAFADSFSRKCAVRFHSAIDGPLLKQFGGEWVGNVLRKLGMHEGEMIESRMVRRRIKAAQRRIAAQVGEPRDAESAEKWVEANPFK